MSSTNRGAKREQNDYYVTPEWCVGEVCWWLSRNMPLPQTVIDPCAGSGAIVEGARKYWPDATIHASDIDVRADYVVQCDALVTPWPMDIDLVLMNPPFAQAQEFIERAFRQAPEAVVVALLRLGFLASEKRREFWSDHLDCHVLVLPKRPAFVRGTTDSCDYAWVVWGLNSGLGGQWCRL